MRRQLSDGWEVARSQPGECDGPAATAGLDWHPAKVPGTVAGALGGEAAEPGLDDFDWWYRISLAEPAGDAGEQVVLGLGGLATVAEVYVGGQLVLESDSMFLSHELDIGDRLRDGDELAICFRALAPVLAAPRRPRARWRTKIASPAGLRFARTMLMGRAPGFAPGPPVVGPWRPVWMERRRGLVLGARPWLRAGLRGAGVGELDVRANLRAFGAAVLPSELVVRLTDPDGGLTEHRLGVEPGPEGLGIVRGVVNVADVRRWWPHTHGEPALYALELVAGDQTLHSCRVGFRDLRCADDLVADGLDLHINGVPVFARGAVWTPVSLAAPTAEEDELRRVLGRVVAGGMNMLRVPGTGAYESELFHDLCDELGILVWQDLMFANFDYPESDPGFMTAVTLEVREQLEALGRRPSLAVVCGGSEVAQQVAMLGLDPKLAEGLLFAGLLPALVAEAEIQAPYVPSAPCGGELPFRTDTGVANYYGVGAYLRPLEDARRAEVRFASECLAFANVPDGDQLPAPGTAAWKAGVARDVGAEWDFDDVRDHYLGLLFGVDPAELRSSDPTRFIELSRIASGEVMAETLGEWRRAGSPCGGALILWLKDLLPGAGWGLLDHLGDPKVAFHCVRRACAPVATWSTDEGLGGYLAHVANDRPEPLVARLRVSMYRDLRLLVDEAELELELGPHGYVAHNVEGLLGRFVDVTWAYRFGPPAQDLVAITLERAGDEPESLSQVFRFPAGRPLAQLAADELGLAATVRDGRLHVTSSVFAYGVRVSIPGWEASDDAFGVEPGHERVLELTPTGSSSEGEGFVSAVNLTGTVPVTRA